MKHHFTGRIYSIIALCAGLSLFAGSLHAGVLAKLSTSSTGLDRPVQLTLESQDEEDRAPDLSVLDKDFEILGRASQQSVSIINGSYSAKHSLILTLLPKRAGKLTIPPIPFGDRQTEPLTLEVTEQPIGDDTSSDKLAWVEMHLDKENAYPEEEVILTVKLFQAAGVRGEHLDQPQPSPGDTRLQLLDESSYTAERNNRTYRVLERSYGLYAYQSGSLKIPSLKFRGRSGGSSVFSLFDNPFGAPPTASRLIRTKSNPISLQIRQIPAEFRGDHWLPARNIQLVETGIDQSAALIAGKPITRRIMLVADGLISSQLPAISPRIPDEIKVYEERPQLRDTPRRTGISSSRESVVTLIPTQAGRYTLPAVEIPWWNTKTGKQEIAQLPEVSLNVMPGTTADTPPVATVTQPLSSDKTTDETPPAEPVTPKPAGIHWLVWVLAAAWLLTLMGWWLSHRRRSTVEPPSTPATPPGFDQQALTAIIEKLGKAYREDDATGAREAWLQWGKQRWPDNPPLNLTRLAGRCPPKVAEAVIALEKALYSPSGETAWAAHFDPASLAEQREEASRSRAVDERLLPLNP